MKISVLTSDTIIPDWYLVLELLCHRLGTVWESLSCWRCKSVKLERRIV